MLKPRKEAAHNRAALSPANKAHPEAFVQESSNYPQLFHDRSVILQEAWMAASDRIITLTVGAFHIGLDKFVAKARKSFEATLKPAEVYVVAL